MQRLSTKKKKLAIFFNSYRGLGLLMALKKKYLVDIFLCEKNLNQDIKSKLRGIKYTLISKIKEIKKEKANSFAKKKVIILEEIY